ncbi:hypothetical protein [Bradyrhizobium neotropicale]|uniref:Uncharacterized protein n=1 Tax=Bradyrhizobium neotropicale TaxID=1497615 RepID=A0A176ZD48_9BRAD|nr:hypothetical protein [Bradyrhizobium neotropicale]OAF17855.1 hypothetical protein AXW67_06965 [Bradyrhizobium neotropicale]
MGPIENFLTEMREQPCIGSELVDQLEGAHRAMEAEALSNMHARELLRAINWITAHTERSIVERLDQIQRLTSFKTHVILNMPHFTGWT